MSVDRDKILEQALKHELRGDTAATPQLAHRSLGEGGCLDAELLAAWQDEALNAAQMADIELHVSTCERCRSMLAAFARGTVEPESAPSASVAGGNVSWWKWWLAPLAAGAAAVTLWMVVPEQQQVATRPPAPTASVAVGKVEPPAAVEEKRADAPPARAAELETRAREADSVSADSKLRATVARDERQQLKDQPAAAAKEEVAVAQAPPPPPTSPAAPPAPVALAAPAARAAQPEAAGARANELQKSTRSAFAPVEVSTLDRNVRWRIVGNRIDRTDDAGQSWTTKHERLGENIASGSAPSSAVGWFAGRAGIVILTTDAGATFAEVGLAEPLDIASISATDARTAVLSTVGGRRFRTEDGGRTWLPF